LRSLGGICYPGGMKKVGVKDFFIGQGEPLVIISGPCVIESEEFALQTAGALKEIFSSLGIPLIYKSSYDKANRSSYDSFRGPGLEEGLRILERVKKEFNLPILTDVHSPQEALAAAEVCDVLQIPAFLCRQTDLVIAAARTGRVINVKKGQFLSPWEIQNIIDKILSTHNQEILITERGTSFGYNNLVSDMRAIPIMQSFGFPVCYDATHSLMLPGGQGKSSGGQREFIRPLTNAAAGAGCNAFFIECHPHPPHALSDRDTVLPIADLKKIVSEAKSIYDIVQKSNV
jgi:2-dehydro-3-deoxyphosphooctonate aldolase (KDO 8-P synthase)